MSKNSRKHSYENPGTLCKSVLPATSKEVGGKAPYTNLGGPRIHKMSKDWILHSDLKKEIYENDLSNGYKLDWLSFTVSSEKYSLEDILNSLNYNIIEFETISGRYFYNSGLSLGFYVNVYFNDSDKERFVGSSETINFVFTGQGCTDLYLRNNCDIFNVFRILLNFEINVTRIDIAYDDFFGILDFNLICNKLNNGEYRSSKKSYNIVKSSNVNGEILGQTIYIGSSRNTSSKGNFYARFYDKKSQYEQKNQILPLIAQNTGIWQRYEISYTKTKANNVFYNLVKDTEYKYNIDKLYKTSLRSIIEFLEPKQTINKSRWPVCFWWENFLCFNSKIEFVNHERDLDIGGLLDWLESSVIPNLKLLEVLLDIFGYDVYELLRNYEFTKDFSKKQNRIYNNNKNSKIEDIEFYLSKYLKLNKGKGDFDV